MFEITPEFEIFCREQKIIPERLIAQFMADACGGKGNGGSNERLAASSYVESVRHLIVEDQAAFWREYHGRVDEIVKRRSAS